MGKYFSSFVRTALVALCVGVLFVGCSQAEQSDAVSPFDEDYGDPIKASQEVFVRSQELARECMKSKGFEYWQVSPPVRNYPDGQERGTDAWRERYGFGISTELFPQPQLDPPLIGYPIDESASDSQVQGSMSYLDSLSEGERLAYEEALYGSNAPGMGASEEEVTAHFENSDGCLYSSQRDAASENVQFVLWSEFGAELLEMEERISNDPEVLAYEAKISKCVSAEGMSWSTHRAEIKRIRQETETIKMGQLVEGGVPTFKLSDADAELLHNIQQEEVLLASLAHTCESQIGDRTIATAETRKKYERDFLTEHGDRFNN